MFYLKFIFLNKSACGIDEINLLIQQGNVSTTTRIHCLQIIKAKYNANCFYRTLIAGNTVGL